MTLLELNSPRIEDRQHQHTSMPMRRRVVITGMGAITPLGNDLKTTWQAVINGRSGIGLITRFDASTFPVKIAGEVRDFQFDCSLLPRDCSGLVGRSAQLGIAAARMALEDAGLLLPAVEQPVMGISLGADEEYIPLRNIPDFFNRDYLYRAYTDPWTLHTRRRCRNRLQRESFFPSGGGQTWAQQLPLFCLISAGRHPRCIRPAHQAGTLSARPSGLSKAATVIYALAGGHCSMLTEHAVAGFYLLGTLSTRNDDPLRASRPFDRTRDGFVMSEGAGMLILEELSHAQKRGARIYAELSGCGSSSNAYRITDSPPDGRGGDLCMKRALADAGKDIDRHRLYKCSRHSHRAER